MLQSFRRPRSTTNPYIALLAQALRDTPGVEPLDFSFRAALFGNYDVVHIQWPEVMLSAQGPLRRLGRRLLFSLLLVRLWLRSTPVVRTVHNLEAHEQRPSADRWLMKLLDRMTTFWIRLNPLTELPPGEPHETILHGHYRDWYSDLPRARRVPGRLGSFGLIRAYKGTEALIGSFRELESSDLSLSIGGQPLTAEIERSVRSLADGDPRIDMELRHLSDGELVRLISESELVVLPYRSMHNSGAVLAALSLDRPVLVPDNEVNSVLAEEVGPGWVVRYRGPLTSGAIEDALGLVRSACRSDRPNLSARGWADAGTAHLRAYRRSMHDVRPR